MSRHVAVIITNYNMPERTDKICRHLIRTAVWPYKLIVVDNGSDLIRLSRYTTIKLEKNIQTTNGWLEGLRHAKSIRDDWFAYWFLITSAEFPPNKNTPLTPLASFLMANENAVGIHPSLTQCSTTAWRDMIYCGDNQPRPIWAFDNIASLYRADWFDSIGWFDPELIYGWGIDIETGWKARSQGRSLWIHEGCKIKKITDIGYKMNRMNMSAQERRELASSNMSEVLSRKYGHEWLRRLSNEFVTKDMRLDTRDSPN